MLPIIAESLQFDLFYSGCKIYSGCKSIGAAKNVSDQGKIKTSFLKADQNQNNCSDPQEFQKESKFFPEKFRPVS